MQFAIEPDDDPRVMRVHIRGESELDDLLLACMASEEIEVRVVLEGSSAMQSD